MHSCSFIWASNKIVPKQILGRGAQGLVVCIKNDQAKQALKHFFDSDHFVQHLENMIREVFGSSTCHERLELWQTPSHQVGLLQTVWDTSLINVLDILWTLEDRALIIRDLFFHVMINLIDLHNHGLIHRDIKPANILVKIADRRTCLMDFGLVGGPNLEEPKIQSKPQRPPEVYEGLRATEASDVFSFGLNLLLAYNGKLLTNHSKQVDLLHLLKILPDICRGMGYHADLDILLNDSHDALLARLVFKMCQRNPHDRISLSQVMEDDFWKKTHEVRSDFWTMLTRQNESFRMRQISEGLQKLSPTELDTIYTLIEEHESILLKPIRIFEKPLDAWPLQDQVDRVLQDWGDCLHWNSATLQMACKISHRVQSSEVPDLIVVSLIAMVFCTGTRCQMMTAYKNLMDLFHEEYTDDDIWQSFFKIVKTTGGVLPKKPSIPSVSPIQYHDSSSTSPENAMHEKN